MSAMEALISDDVALELSGRLCRLGDQWQELCAELQAAGYGNPSAIKRSALESLAETDENRARLRAYWREWSKERLAGLTGPMNVLKGKYPRNPAYRSTLMSQLRDDVATGKVKSEGLFLSPQIEPTEKRSMERGVDCPEFIQLHAEIKRARREAAAAHGLTDDLSFIISGELDRYKLLIERYRASLAPSGFTLDSHRKTGLVFRRLTSNKRWAFLMVDQSRAGTKTGSLSPSFALTLPKKAVLPELMGLSSVATFTPDDIVPWFRWSCGFDRDSYAEFCLAADSIACLTKLTYERIDNLLA